MMEITFKNIKQLLEISNKINNGALTKKDTGKNSLESMVIDLLEPEITKWLEANLSAIVNNIVERELKKLLDPHES